MPTYEYACDACGKGFEIEQRITEPAVNKCPACGELKARRMISGGNFLLKGGGWYADGYAGKSNGGSGKSSGGSAEKSESSSTKSESAPAAAPAATTKSSD